MNNPFSQPKTIYKISFNTKYEHIESFEEFFSEEKILGTSVYEVESSTIEAHPDDIWSFEVLVKEKPNFPDLKKNLEKFIEENSLKILSSISIEKIEDRDWVKEYQKQLKPLEIGRFFITSSMHEKSCPKDKIPIFIEASRAFGTGDHSTTSLCIQAMEEMHQEQFSYILDIGTGSGILSFVAGKLWSNSSILACDVDEISIEVAKENQTFNNSNIEFYQNNMSSLDIPRNWSLSFDLIVSNILAKPLIAMKDDIRNLCHSKTKVILSGFLDYQKDELEQEYRDSGFVVEKIFHKNSWITMILRK
jgi:ribosomal protein L11 methyltransferase